MINIFKKPDFGISRLTRYTRIIEIGWYIKNLFFIEYLNYLTNFMFLPYKYKLIDIAVAIRVRDLRGNAVSNILPPSTPPEKAIVLFTKILPFIGCTSTVPEPHSDDKIESTIIYLEVISPLQWCGQQPL